MTMIEKVARAIAQADERNGFPCYDVRVSNKHTKEVLFDEARAAMLEVAEVLADQCSADSDFIIGQIRYEAQKK
jgi:hypothetical protein